MVERVQFLVIYKNYALVGDGREGEGGGENRRLTSIFKNFGKIFKNWGQSTIFMIYVHINQLSPLLGPSSLNSISLSKRPIEQPDDEKRWSRCPGRPAPSFLGTENGGFEKVRLGLGFINLQIFIKLIYKYPRLSRTFLRLPKKGTRRGPKPGQKQQQAKPSQKSDRYLAKKLKTVARSSTNFLRISFFWAFTSQVR